MNYKTYAEAKIANPDCEIVTTGKGWVYDKELIGTFEPRVTEGCSHAINDYSWVICNPADYCSTLKEFLDAGFKLVEGDKYIGINGNALEVKQSSHETEKDDESRYILSAAALNGCCKIPDTEVCSNSVLDKDYEINNHVLLHSIDTRLRYGVHTAKRPVSLDSGYLTIQGYFKDVDIKLFVDAYDINAVMWVGCTFENCKNIPKEGNMFGCLIIENSNKESDEQWTIYNNTLPLDELNSEQAAQLFNAWRKNNEILEFFVENWSNVKPKQMSINGVYRIKSKQERELFIDKSMEVCKENQHNKFEFILGKIYDSGARYTDLTQHFGESI